MREGKLFILLVVAVRLSYMGLAQAQDRVPAGCFVTDAERALYTQPPECFNQERAPYVHYTIDNGYSEEAILAFYGFQHGFMVNTSRDLFYKWQDAESRAAQNSNSSNIHYGWYAAEFDKNKRLRLLEKQLRKVCGVKCKKIQTVKSLSEVGGGDNLRQSLPSAAVDARWLSFDQYIRGTK